MRDARSDQPTGPLGRGPKGQVLFIQGGGEGTHDEWDRRLVANLKRALGPGHEVRYPRMPDEGRPDFETWSGAIAQEIGRLDRVAALVAHSVGATIAIHALAEQPHLLRPLSVIGLIAPPFVGEGGWPADGIRSDPGWAAPLAGVAVHLYQGDADETTPPAHLDLWATAIPEARLHRLAGRDHQLDDDLTEVARDLLRTWREA